MNKTNHNDFYGQDGACNLTARIWKWTPVYLLIVAMGMAPSAKADLFCVSNVSELNTALSIAQINNQSDEIRIRQGTYLMPGGTGPDTNVYPHSLIISGGWNSTCTVRSLDPAATTINGQGGSGSSWDLRSNASLTLDGLRFVNNDIIILRDRVSPQCTASGQKITVRRINVDGGIGPWALYLDSRCHAARVENSLIVNSQSGGISLICSGSMSYQLTNNTVRDSSGEGLRAEASFINPCTSHGIGLNRLYNNLIDKVHLDGATPLALNNIFGQVTTEDGGGLLSGSSDNSNVNPQLDSDYRPIEPGSPAINSGTDNVPGGLPATDIEGSPRDIGGIPDRGAYESSVVPPGSFVITVTNGTDNGVGTLRSAIEQANAGPGLNLIQFDLPGCAFQIQLSTPLPDITEPLIIDGFSQPGASVNTLDHGNNSVLCIQLVALSGVNVPWALRVPPTSSAALKVRGISFHGFNSGGGLLGEAAIFLQGGSGHEIQGNYFGALDTTNSEGVRLMNNATSALIGGSSPAHRNTFSNSTVAAIRILGTGPDNHRIINNYIGTTPSGLSADGNLDGIRIIQSGGNHVLDNLISGNTRDGIYISGEHATGNIVGNNRIGGIRAGFFQICGPSPLPPCPAPLTNRKGVFIENEANNNSIGPTTFVGGPNRIRYSTQHGVRVLSGQRNRILGNSLFDNGTGANELDIDIDAFGLGAIDSDCGASADGKANRGQNRPVIATAEADGNTLSVTGTLSSCTNSGGFDAVYRLQFFASNNCAANGHGPGRYFLGDHNVFLSGPVQTDVTEPFAAELEHPWLNLGGMYITATATDIFGNTSEFSQCIQAEVSDVLFSDRFEQP